MTTGTPKPNAHAKRRTLWRAGRMASCLAALAMLVAIPARAETILADAIRVIDGDTIDVAGDRFRLVGFDTPETYGPKCDYERALGQEATARLRSLLDVVQRAELVVLPGRDRYGRGLARLLVAKRDVGDILISEGLARAYQGGRREGWC